MSEPSLIEQREEAEKNRSCENCLYHYCTHFTKHEHTETSNDTTLQKDKHVCNYGVGTGRTLKCFEACSNWRHEKELDSNIATSFERRISRLEYYMEKLKP